MNVNPAAVLIVAFGTVVGAIFGAALIGAAVTLGVITFFTVFGARS